ncbi:MAG TPA: heme-binding domain-containing protein [Chitinophagaceae bacterium]|nr:heme-binding domain-containing protein [Chitinophagaceae bacterium]
MFKKILKYTALVLTVIFIVIQFFHPKKNIAEGPQPNYIGNHFPVPDNVKAIMAKACNDCHSNNTRYPWYSKIQPIDWWLNKHVVEGKREINYDEFTNRSLRFQYHKMEETIEMIKDGKMPLNSYTWTHKDAKLTKEEKSNITNWAQSVQDSMKAKYPMDSLVRPKR